MSAASLSPPLYTSVQHTQKRTVNRLRRLVLKPTNNNSISSLIDDKDSKMSHPGPADSDMVFNYLRPQNQLVLLLQKGQSFPSYPHELTGCVSHYSDTFVWCHI